MGISQMLQALGNNDTLETLVLHTNNLQDDGAEAIANYMAGLCLYAFSSTTITCCSNLAVLYVVHSCMHFSNLTPRSCPSLCAYIQDSLGFALWCIHGEFHVDYASPSSEDMQASMLLDTKQHRLSLLHP